MKYWPFIPLISLLFIGCAEQQPVYRPVPVKKEVPKPQPKPVITPVKPKKIHELKEVEDDNFDPAYMYPETPSKKAKKTPEPEPIAVAASQMSKEECVDMIGQEKFDKYTQMLGSETAAIKRCVLLKSMR